MVASTSPTENKTVFSPNTYLNVKVGGAGTAVGYASTVTGNCKAEFIEN